MSGAFNPNSNETKFGFWLEAELKILLTKKFKWHLISDQANKDGEKRFPDQFWKSNLGQLIFLEAKAYSCSDWYRAEGQFQYGIPTYQFRRYIDQMSHMPKSWLLWYAFYDASCGLGAFVPMKDMLANIHHEYDNRSGKLNSATTFFNKSFVLSGIPFNLVLPKSKGTVIQLDEYYANGVPKYKVIMK